MLRAVLVMEYDPNPEPVPNPILPAVVEMLTIIFFVLLSTRGRNACETHAGPTTLVRRASRRLSLSSENAVSYPPGF